MKLNKKVEEVLNNQVNVEFWSAYMYLSMASWFEAKGLKGFANWMRVQFQEETTHALKIYDFVLNRTGEMKLQPLAEVPTTWENITDAFKETYEHECKVTEQIYNCFNVAEAEKDHATTSMLKWFIDEQAEEESNVVAILDQLNLIGENGQAIYLLDKELATRVFVDPTKAAIA
jgi:ferritin